MTATVFLLHAVFGCAAAASGEADGGTGNPIELVRTVFSEINRGLEAAKVLPTHYCNSNTRTAWTVARANTQVGPGCWTQASVYRLDGEVRKIVLDEVLPSGDAQIRVEYYYYPGGRLSFRFRHLITHHGGDGSASWPEGPYHVESRAYFAPSGIQVRDLQKAYARNGVVIAPRHVSSIETPAFLELAAVPFIQTSSHK